MDRDAIFLFALGMLVAAAFVVGVSGWVLFVRDRRLVKASHGAGAAADVHPEAPEDS